jgi:hypothetical protein
LLQLRFLSVTFLILLLVVGLSADSLSPDEIEAQTLGLFVYDTTAYDGYNLISPFAGNVTYLVDMYGRIVQSWEGDSIPANTSYLLETGELLRPTRTLAGPGGAGGKIQKFAWDGTLLWDYSFDRVGFLPHHDVHPMPNGNVLVLGWDFYTDAEAVQAGRDPSTIPLQSELWPERIVELQQTGLNTADVVWEWRVFDHLVQEFDPTKDNYGVVADHPELMDINYNSHLARRDWLHGNSVCYNPLLDQIIVSFRATSEIWVIDHSTTTAEAAAHSGGTYGMGGDILYRWGNPTAYQRGDSTQITLNGQHDAQWIEPGLPGEGNMLIFDNGSDRGFTAVAEIVPPVNPDGTYDLPAAGMPFGPADFEWYYTADPPESWVSLFISGAQRQPNGNTLVCDGPFGHVFEVTPDDAIVWEYYQPVTIGSERLPQGDPVSQTSMFRCLRYPADYPGLIGKDLSPGSPIELYVTEIAGTAHTPLAPSDTDTVVITTAITPTNSLTDVTLWMDDGSGAVAYLLFDDGAHSDGLAGDLLYGAEIPAMVAGTHIRYWVETTDNLANIVVDPASAPATAYLYYVTSDCCVGAQGDVNGDGNDADIVDLTFVADYLFAGGPNPTCNAEADANGDGLLADIVDLTYIADFLFSGGPPPPNCP